MKINFLLEGRIYGWELQKKGNSKVDDSEAKMPRA